MNPVAIVTGGSRGIGRGIALELSAAGYDLVINCNRNVAAARATVRDCISAGADSGRTVRAEVCRADISNAAGRRLLISFTRKRFGGLDMLVNNAGVAPLVRADLLEASEESFDRVLRINLKGPYFLTQLAANWMIQQLESGRAKKNGRLPGPNYSPKIITISSISATAASVNRGDYCVSKAGLSMMTSLYSSRLAEYGIQVFEIRPGIIATDMTVPVKAKYDRLIGGGLSPIKRWGVPGDVGKAVSAIARGLLPFSTGEIIHVDGGFHISRL
jgi:NAD(P)-dependent dehydrogenase (short-subunit alcohol dehydrogenase family)